MSEVQPTLQVQSDLIVSEELFDEIVRSEEKFCLEIPRWVPRVAIMNLVNGYKGAFDYIHPYLSLYDRPKILELGSGNGFGLCYMLKCGLDVVGIEPGSEISFEGRFQRAMSLLELNGIPSPTSRLVPAFAEKMPFADNTFDLVFSIAVIEHVIDVEQTLREALRVVKPDGLVLMNVPNYNTFREGHYIIPWIPYLLAQKKIAKWYVRTIFHRPDYYIDELNFTTPRHFKKLARALPESREMRIYRYCVPPFANLSALYYQRGLALLSKGAKYRSLTAHEVNTFRGTRSFRGRVRYGLHLTGRLLKFFFLGWALKLLSAFGLAPVFNIVCSKRSSS